MRRINSQKSSKRKKIYRSDDNLDLSDDYDIEKSSRPIKKRRVIESDQESKDIVVVNVGELKPFEILGDDFYLIEWVGDALTSQRRWEKVQSVP